jgi:hypothetical protein
MQPLTSQVVNGLNLLIMDSPSMFMSRKRRPSSGSGQIPWRITSLVDSRDSAPSLEGMSADTASPFSWCCCLSFLSSSLLSSLLDRPLV